MSETGSEVPDVGATMGLEDDLPPEAHLTLSAIIAWRERYIDLSPAARRQVRALTPNRSEFFTLLMDEVDASSAPLRIRA